MGQTGSEHETDIPEATASAVVFFSNQHIKEDGLDHELGRMTEASLPVVFDIRRGKFSIIHGSHPQTLRASVVKKSNHPL
jgi:hypothetical protein